MNRSDYGALTALSASIVFVVAVATQDFSTAAALVAIAMALNALMLGRALISLLPESPPGFRAPSEIVVGLTTMSLIMVLTRTFLPIGAATAFFASCAIGAAAFFSRVGKLRDLQHWTRMDVLVLAIVCFVSVVWSWEAIRAMPTLHATGRFPVWADYYLHAARVAEFARPGVTNYGTFYHNASYLPAAAFVGLTGTPALVSATALWTTLGFIVLGLGAYALGSTLGGRIAGIGAVAALLLVPDAAHYGLHNGFFDFHWLEQITTGGSYATGVALVGIAFVLLSRRHHSTRAFWLAVATSLGVLGLRSQVFLPLAIAATLMFIFLWRPAGGYVRIAAMMALALVGMLAISAAEHIERAPHLLSGGWPDPIGFTRMMVQFGPSAFPRLLGAIDGQSPSPVTVAAAIVYLLFAASGAMLLAYVGGAVWCLRRGLMPVERFVPLAFIAAFVLVLFIPPLQTHDDPFQMQHRQFVLLYAVLAVWVGTFAARFAKERLGCRAIAAAAATTCLLLPVPFLLSPTAQLPGGRGRDPGLGWADSYVGQMIPRALIEGADFLRTHAKRNDVVMAATNYLCGPLSAMTERTTIFPEPCEPRSVSPQSTTPTRPAPDGSLPERMAHAPRYDAFLALAQERHVDWFVIYSLEFPVGWMVAKAAWRKGNVVVLRVEDDAH